jgi:Putative zinc-finger
MDHQQATQRTAVEKYLLDELTGEERDQFEEHFFDCQECATDLRATAGFMAAAKNEFKVNPVPKPAGVRKGKSFFASFSPVLVWSALAACLVVIAYQYTVVYPRFKSEISQLAAPEILPTLSLVGGNSRGGQVPAAAFEASHGFLLQVDIPTQDRFSSYACLLYSPSGSLSWRVEVPAQLARDTVSIRVPSADRPSGQYTLTVQGNVDAKIQSKIQPREAPVELARYRFTLNTHN